MSIPRRILLVDDVADWREMLMGLLEDEGYRVRTAESTAEALRVSAVERFHLAILDVRLDETDEGNTEGLDLMFELKQRDPTITVIILTGYATVDMVRRGLSPSRDGTAPASDFVVKEEATSRLLSSIERAFRSEVKINYRLSICDEAGVLRQAALRYSRGAEQRRVDERDLFEEIQELLCKLFVDAEQILIRPMSAGFSGTAAILVFPKYQRRGAGEAVVVKLGTRRQIMDEALAYETFVKGVLGGNRLPAKLGVAATRSLGGIIYSLAGATLGKTRDFATFYDQEEVSKVEKVLVNFFKDAYFPLAGARRVAGGAFDFTEHYRRHLHLDQAELDETLRDLLHRKRGPGVALTEAREGLRFVALDTALPNPVQFVRKELVAPTYRCTVHGDLNGRNILVDSNDGVWLIDFERTGEGHLLQDYASLESFVRFSLLDVEDLKLLYEWEKALLAGTGLKQPPEFSAAHQEAGLVKASRIIGRIRRLARGAKGEPDMREYYIALLFQALKTLTVPLLPRAKREHALISAALLAQKLSEHA